MLTTHLHLMPRLRMRGFKFSLPLYLNKDRGSSVVKVLCYKSVGRWFDPSWCQLIFH